MASIRPQIALATAIACVALVACSERVETESVPGSVPDGAYPTVAPWVADANGASLFEDLADRARERAQRPYRVPDRSLVAGAAALDYTEYRDIRFREARTFWRDKAPFEVQLFHPGGASDVPVRVHLVEEGRSRRLPFDGELFTYGDVVGEAPEMVDGSGFAGFKLLFPMNEPGKMDEVASFLGASYFRILGPDQVYGLSARGLAVDVAEPGGEEFPDFVAFWLVRPEHDAESLTFYALLDGPSVAGAYRFALDPGVDERSGTVLDVEARLFFRRGVGKLGLAPLTSMYLHGPLAPDEADDYRPRVHDSEGLSMLTADGEWIWRPLTNGDGVRVTSLRDVDPRGFGLVQRTRAFDEYLDLEALYHRRPSVWVDIDEPWGTGGVELVEIPTTSEFNDNIVAYWSPDTRPGPGDAMEVRYRLVTFDAVPSEQGRAHVARTRIGRDALPGEADPPSRSRRRVVVDFRGGGLPDLASDTEVAASLSTSSGTVSDLRVRRLPDGGRRATFALEPEGDRAADMRLYLLVADTAVTATWSYLWEPDLVR